MAANHNDTITIVITLEPAPAPLRGFGTTLHIVDQANNTLGGDRTRRYSTLAGAQADNTAGEISALTLAFITAAFSQAPRPVDVLIGRQDTAGAETLTAAIAAIVVDDSDFYAITSYSRVDADIVEVSGVVEAMTPGRLFFFQSDDADWQTSGLPAGIASLAGNERSVPVYHDADAEPNAFAWAATRMSFNPDVTSAAFNGEVKTIAALSPAPTDTQKGFLRANGANFGLPFGGVVFWMDPGINMNNRPIYEMVTADWYQDRLQAKVADIVAQKSALGEKITVDAEGQTLILAQVDAQFVEGEAAGHFVAGQTNSFGVPITQADRDAQRMRFGGNGQIAVNGRLFDFAMFFGRDPVNAAA